MPTIPATKRLAYLPFQQAHELRRAYMSEDKTEFLAYLIAYHNAGWPHRALADSIAITTSLIAEWLYIAEKNTRAQDKAQTLTVLPLPFNFKGAISFYKLKAFEPRLSEKRVKEISTYYSDSLHQQRHTPSGKIAAKAFVSAIRYEVDTNQRPLRQIAAQTGISRTAILQRLQEDTQSV